MKPKILILDYQERGSYYQDIRQALDADWLHNPSDEVIQQHHSSFDLALVSDEKAGPFIVPTIINLSKHNVPVLHIADGILEWRNVWENPTFDVQGEKAMPLFQPVVSHKIACLGRSQARYLESWGNIGKCEIVGMPRLDKYLPVNKRKPQKKNEVKILIMTARKPAFNEIQLKKTLQCLEDLGNWLQAHKQYHGVNIQPIWRLTEGLSKKIKLNNMLVDNNDKDLFEQLQSVDILITTPSTAMIEGLLMGIPVVLLNYHNCPLYVPAAWSISAPQHIEDIMGEIISPPVEKLLYQETVLHDSLECRTPSLDRLVTLINEMVRLSKKCRANNKPISFPHRILHQQDVETHIPETSYNLKELFPHHTVFSNMDSINMQVELGHLRRQQALLKQLKASWIVKLLLLIKNWFVK